MYRRYGTGADCLWGTALGGGSGALKCPTVEGPGAGGGGRAGRDAVGDHVRAPRPSSTSRTSGQAKGRPADSPARGPASPAAGSPA